MYGYQSYKISNYASISNKVLIEIQIALINPNVSKTYLIDIGTYDTKQNAIIDLK